MTTFTTNSPARPFFGNLSNIVANFVETARQYYQYRQTVRALSALTAAELSDLGLSRSGIKSVSIEAVYGA